MDLFDQVAFLGRRYEPQFVPSTGSRRFSMTDLLQMFGRSAILEMTPYVGDRAHQTLRPDPVRKMKVSLLDDGLAALPSTANDWYEVYRTAPSGDLSKVRIVAYSAAGGRSGELRMLVGRRSFDHYFEDDPIFEKIAQRSS
jgi:hypothetical protein